MRQPARSKTYSFKCSTKHFYSSNTANRAKSSRWPAGQREHLWETSHMSSTHFKSGCTELDNNFRFNSEVPKVQVDNLSRQTLRI